jgi:hypothetical protein
MHLSRVGFALGMVGVLSTLGACRRIEETSGTIARGARLALTYSSNLDGEIEPCG